MMESTNDQREVSSDVCEIFEFPGADKITKAAPKKKRVSKFQKIGKFKKTKKSDKRVGTDVDMIVDYLKCESEVLNSMNKRIFKKSTIQNIEKILALLRQDKIGSIIENHYQTVKTMFWGLVFGAIPVCEIQRQNITELQRTLVDRILDLPAKKGQLVLREEEGELSSFLNIIKRSLKFIIKMFYFQFTKTT